MSDRLRTEPSLDLGRLRQAIQEEYTAVARDPGRGYHFHTGRPLASMLGYRDDWLEGLPEGSVASFAGTGNPFRIGHLQPGERVVDIGSGAGIDSLIAAKMVGPSGQVIGVDMTPAMLEMARKSVSEAGAGHVEFREGLAESLPVPNSWADVVISNGVLNSLPCRRWLACSNPAAASTSGISWCSRRCQRTRNSRSICGRAELPVLCWK